MHIEVDLYFYLRHKMLMIYLNVNYTWVLNGHISYPSGYNKHHSMN